MEKLKNQNFSNPCDCEKCKKNRLADALYEIQQAYKNPIIGYRVFLSQVS